MLRTSSFETHTKFVQSAAQQPTEQKARHIQGAALRMMIQRSFFVELRISCPSTPSFRWPTIRVLNWTIFLVGRSPHSSTVRWPLSQYSLHRLDARNGDELKYCITVQYCRDRKTWLGFQPSVRSASKDITAKLWNPQTPTSRK